MCWLTFLWIVYLCFAFNFSFIFVAQWVQSDIAFICQNQDCGVDDDYKYLNEIEEKIGGRKVKIDVYVDFLNDIKYMKELCIAP